MSLLLKNRYQVLQVLSEAGGFGQTFLAEDTDTPSRRKCVIKKLRPLADEEDFKFVQERFQREAAILERLGDSCDQIPKLYAYFVENHEFYLVQEFIDGLTLRQKLQQEGVLNEDKVRELLWGLLNVLEYVHGQNIIHRDLKPDNVILRARDNKPVLIDFGIVKEVLRVGVDGSPTSSVMAGTPGYTALEQAAGRPVYASDFYSLGATAIYLLTGKNPQQMTDLVTGDITWRQFAPQASPALAAVLDKATESAVRDRYKTVAEMREDLQKVFRGEPPVAAPLVPAPAEEETIVRPVIPLSQQPPKSNYVLYFVSAAVAGLLVIISAVALLFSLNNSNGKITTATNMQKAGTPRNTNITTPPNTNVATAQNTNVANANSITTNSNIPNSSNINAVNEANILTGKISGKLIYPSEYIPPEIIVCVESVSGKGNFCSNQKGLSERGIKFKVNHSNAAYEATLPEGTYYVYATFSRGKAPTEDMVNEKAYYTEFVKCGMNVNCSSHKKVPVTIEAEKTIKRIDLGDWYDF